MALFAPYNFVPLNKKVVLPHWADHISHDIPFEDQVSGSFKVKITAKTPIFIKDGLSKEKEQLKYRNDVQIVPHKFNNLDGKYFIPGSSIKGMVRNVMEIMSFGKMYRVNNHRYAIRDLNNEKLYRNHFGTNKVYGGWLKKVVHTDKDYSYEISGWGIPGRISHKELQEKYNMVDFSTYFSSGGRFDPKKDREKSAQRKYDKFGSNSLKGHFAYLKDDAGRQIYNASKQKTDKAGTLVFTGQSGYREFNNRQNKMVGHFYEFIFFDQNKQTPLPVDDSVIENLFFAYFDNDKKKQSIDWKAKKNKLENNQPIPIFFQFEGNNVNNNVEHLGLSYLYKLPYKNSVKEAIDQYQEGMGVDLADAIFGYIDDNETCLKGRVHIGHAFATQNCKEGDEVKAVLSSPKASFYPNYIRQDIKNGKVSRYNTFMDNQPTLAGWKRYPIKANPTKNEMPNRSTEKILTRFKPLKEGATFELTIRYHNLLQIELGALISSLTFHDTDNVLHNIGMGKPLGYGVIETEILGIEKLPYLMAFESYMDYSLGNSVNLWHQSEQITDLFTMAHFQNNSENSQLKYMELKGFREAKQRQNKFGLDRYSKLKNIVSVPANTYISIEDILEKKQWVESNQAKLSQNQSIHDIIIQNKTKAKKAFKQKQLELLKELDTLREKQVFKEKNQPQMCPLSKLRKPREVDAKVIRQEGINVIFTPYVEGFEKTEFRIRYPRGFDVGTIIIVKMLSISKGKNLQVQGAPKLKK